MRNLEAIIRYSIFADYYNSCHYCMVFYLLTHLIMRSGEYPTKIFLKTSLNHCLFSSPLLFSLSLSLSFSLSLYRRQLHVSARWSHGEGFFENQAIYRLLSELGTPYLPLNLTPHQLSPSPSPHPHPHPQTSITSNFLFYPPISTLTSHPFSDQCVILFFKTPLNLVMHINNAVS